MKNRDQLTDWITHRRKFLLVFCHDISFHHIFLMMQVKGMRNQFPSFTLIYFFQSKLKQTLIVCLELYGRPVRKNLAVTCKKFP